MFIFKPENIDPVTMPDYSYSIIPQGGCVFNPWAQGCGGRTGPAHLCVLSLGSLASAGVAAAPEGFVSLIFNKSGQNRKGYIIC